MAVASIDICASHEQHSALRNLETVGQH